MGVFKAEAACEGRAKGMRRACEEYYEWGMQARPGKAKSR